MRRDSSLAVLALAVVSLGALASQVLADLGDCAQPATTGTKPKTSDSLAALRTAVDLPSACDGQDCVCDVNADGTINTTDSLFILRFAVDLPVPLQCDCGCQFIGGGGGGLVARGVPRGGAPLKQVELEVRIVEVTEATAQSLGFDFTTGVSASPPPSGGSSGYEMDLAVTSFYTGGPEFLDYFLYGAHRPAGALPVLNKNFVSPFSDVKTFFQLPYDRCVTFSEGSIKVPEGHPGGDPVDNVLPDDGGYGNVESVAYNLYTPQQASDLIESLEGMSGTEVFDAPMVRLWSGQSAFHMVDDVEPDIDDFSSPFKMRIQDVTIMPFGNFTGPVIDFRPVVDGNNVHIEFRIGTEMATFFFSTAFLIDGTPTDAEIPLHRRSTMMTSIPVMSFQTLLIGGLKLEGNPNVQKGLPVISDIPLVGSMFTRKKLNEANRLLIFVTPAVVFQG